MKTFVLFSLLNIILGDLNVDGVCVIDNELLIYTDLKKENLKIKYCMINEDSHHRLYLQDLTNSFDSTEFLIESQIYTVTLPDEADGEIIFEVLSGNDKSSKIYKSTIETKENGWIRKITLSQPIRVDLKSYPYELNYTIFKWGSKERVICVISDSLDQKVCLDKSFEFLQFCIFSKKISALENDFFQTLENTAKLIRDPDFPKRWLKFLKEVHKAVFETSLSLRMLYSLSSINYNSSVYEASILGRYISPPRVLIYETFKGVFCLDGNELDTIVRFEIITKNVKEEKFLDVFYQIYSFLDKFKKHTKNMWNFLNKKEVMENSYRLERDKKYKKFREFDHKKMLEFLIQARKFFYDYFKIVGFNNWSKVIVSLTEDVLAVWESFCTKYDDEIQTITHEIANLNVGENTKE